MRLNKLDGLRGIFSLMVVFHHIDQIYITDAVYNFFLFRQSHTFVDFFFVLSGYVITLNYEKISSKRELSIFVKKRFARLFPLLAYTLIIFHFLKLVVSFFMPNLTYNPTNFSSSYLSLLDTLLFLNSTFLLGSSTGINYPSWSISSEMISYLFYAFTTLIFFNARNKIFLLTIASVFIFSIIKKEFFFTGDFGFARGILCFLVGFFVHSASKINFRVSSYFEYIILILLLCILYAINVLDIFNYQELYSLFSLIFIPSFFGASILILLKTDGFISYILCHKYLQFLGKISYSIYLNHALIILITPRVMFDLFKMEYSDFNKTLTLFISIIFLVIYSKITHKYIEINFGKKLNKAFLNG